MNNKTNTAARVALLSLATLDLDKAAALAGITNAADAVAYLPAPHRAMISSIRGTMIVPAYQTKTAAHLAAAGFVALGPMDSVTLTERGTDARRALAAS